MRCSATGPKPFIERLGWEVVVKDGYERDRFDDLNPLYLVSVDPDTERYRGSAAASADNRAEHAARRLSAIARGGRGRGERDNLGSVADLHGGPEGQFRTRP